MTKDWVSTENDDDARSRSGEFWAGMRADLDAGQFWADRIKDYRGDPAKRLALAMKKLPLPAAFREAAVAVRALIRAKRKEKEAYDEELTLLYWLAALRSFILDYAPRLQEPGFNVVEAIPGHRLRSLRYSYSQLGYRHLDLLNKTDIKWLTAAWGEPTSHSTLNALQKALWDEYESQLLAQRRHAQAALRAEFERLGQGDGPLPLGSMPKREPARKGCGLLIVLVLGIAACTGWIVW